MLSITWDILKFCAIYWKFKTDSGPVTYRASLSAPQWTLHSLLSLAFISTECQEWKRLENKTMMFDFQRRKKQYFLVFVNLVVEYVWAWTDLLLWDLSRNLSQLHTFGAFSAAFFSTVTYFICCSYAMGNIKACDSPLASLVFWDFCPVFLAQHISFDSIRLQFQKGNCEVARRDGTKLSL